MSNASPFAESRHYCPAETVDVRGVVLPANFAAPSDEYRAARERVALFDRSDRRLLIVTGADRKTWLHNLVTNTVKTLDDHAGNYAFAVNVQGRIQFDLNILSLPDALWLDADAATVAVATNHFERYLITEDATLRDATSTCARLGVAGPQTGAIAEKLGVANFAALPALGSVPLNEGRGLLLRHDFAGLPGLELLVPRTEAAAWWDRLAGNWGVPPAGLRTLDVLRIEAGIPWLGRDIDEHVLPPETGQTERGISYQKGCYLGQEVIERMRSHGVVPRRLVRMRTADGTGLTLPASMHAPEGNAGQITSLVPHPLEPYWVGLGYLRTAISEGAPLSTGEPARPVEIVR